MAHKVRLHNWKNGILTFVDHVFEEIEEALHFARNADSDSYRVYNDQDQLTHTSDSETPATYA